MIINSYGNELTAEDKEALYCAMMLELDAMSKSMELIDFSQHRDIEEIIKNIIYSGMVKETRKVLMLDKCDKCEK